MDRVCNRKHGDEFPQEKIIAFCTQQTCEIKMACCHCYPDYHGDHVTKLVQIRDFHKFTAQDAITIRELRSSIEETRKRLIHQAQEFCNSLLANIAVVLVALIRMIIAMSSLMTQMRIYYQKQDSVNMLSTMYQQLNSGSIINTQSIIPIMESQIIQTQLRQSSSTQTQIRILSSQSSSLVFQYQKLPHEKSPQSSQTISRSITHVMGSVYYERPPAPPIAKPVMQPVAVQNIAQIVIQPPPQWGGGHHGGGGHRGGFGHGHGGPGGKFRGGPPHQQQANNEPYEGRQKYPDGSAYRGLMKGGLRHGKGTCYYPDGSIEIGEYVEDMKEGEHQFAIMKITHKRIYKNGQLINSIAI